MVTINCAYSEVINPSSGVTPILSRSQVWKGLQIKIREAQRFVPVIERCEVLEEKKKNNEEEGPEEKWGQVTRKVWFKSSDGKSVKEVCKSYWPVKVDFHQPDGAVITNTISDGEAEGSMLMTYTFEWRHPDVAEGSEEHMKLMEEHRKGAKMAVSKSLEAMRKMALDGELD